MFILYKIFPYPNSNYCFTGTFHIEDFNDIKSHIIHLFTLDDFNETVKDYNSKIDIPILKSRIFDILKHKTAAVNNNTYKSVKNDLYYTTLDLAPSSKQWKEFLCQKI